MSISIEKFCKILDELGIGHRIHSEVDTIEFMTVTTGPYDIYLKFFYTVHEDRDQIQAHGVLCTQEHGALRTQELDDSDDFNAALRFCNQWNQDIIMPKAFVVEEEKIITCEWAWDTAMEYSDDMIKDMIVNRFLQLTIRCIEMAIQDGLYPGVHPVSNKKQKP